MQFVRLRTLYLPRCVLVPLFAIFLPLVIVAEQGVRRREVASVAGKQMRAK
jgi:hypothetical protein